MNLEDKKIEKLVSALYLLTSFFDNKEPMKWRLRELGAELFSSAERQNTVLEIIHLLTVGKQADLISDMNFNIIHREFSFLLSSHLTLEKLLERSLSEETVSSPKELEMKPSKIEDNPKLYIASSIPKRPEAPIIRDNTYLSKDLDKKPLKEFGVVAVKKSSRQSIIIGLLKRKKEIMIKDVSPLINGVSEKTIQRELLDMVAQKILKKEGEKRWSRYSLAE